MKVRQTALRGIMPIVLILAVLSLAPSCSEGPENPSKAEPAVEIQTISQAGILKTINQAKGKVVLLNFWATWCDPCRAEIKELKELRGEYSEDELLILGLAVDREPAVVKAFAKQAGFNYPVYLATDAAMMFFRVQGVPRLMFYGKDGELRVNREGMVGASGLREIVDSLLAG